jgi:hypothetical protein
MYCPFYSIWKFDNQRILHNLFSTGAAGLIANTLHIVVCLSDMDRSSSLEASCSYWGSSFLLYFVCSVMFEVNVAVLVLQIGLGSSGQAGPTSSTGIQTQKVCVNWVESGVVN